jgi:SNF2 family DNA or RNA helicase
MKLYPHQEAALKSTDGQNRVAYYLDMGLGKTFLGAEKAVRMDSRVNLIVCQKSKVQDWLDHVFNNYDNVECYDLTKKDEMFIFNARSDDDYEAEFYEGNPIFGVINYDLIWRRKELLQLKNFTLILDESSLIQNQKSNRCKFILKMKPENVILLSGTPTGGKYENLWSQLHLLGWNVSEKVYNAQYVNWKKIFIGGMIHKVVDKEDPYKNVERLKQKMRDHGAVFMKTEEVFDLPMQNFIQVNVPTTNEYKKFKRNHLITIDTLNLCEFKDDSDFHGKDITPKVELVGDSILSYRLYQRQLCSAYNPHKIQAFKDILESTQDRLIVFYNFNCELEKLQSICESLDRPYSIVNGSIKNLSNYEQESNSITLVQYQAGAMGLNLQKANKIVYFSLTEEAELFEQSKKRIHRIGQDKPCFYYMLICQNSIEDTEILPTLNIRKGYTDELFAETV